MTFVLEFVTRFQSHSSWIQNDRIVVLNVKEARFRRLEILTICKVAENLKKSLKDAHSLYYSIKSRFVRLVKLG